MHKTISRRLGPETNFAVQTGYKKQQILTESTCSSNGLPYPMLKMQLPPMLLEHCPRNSLNATMTRPTNNGRRSVNHHAFIVAA
jgi:hypothetical protein